MQKNHNGFINGNFSWKLFSSIIYYFDFDLHLSFSFTTVYLQSLHSEPLYYPAALMNSSYKRNHPIFKLVCLVHFTQRYSLKCVIFLQMTQVYPLWLHNTSPCINATFSLSICCWWAHKVLQRFSYSELCCYQNGYIQVSLKYVVFNTFG